MLERQRLFMHKRQPVVCGEFRIGCELCGHVETVHGGITSAVFDNTFGWLAWLNKGAVYTAFLKVDYRTPIPCGQEVFFHTKIDRIDGRKVFVSGAATDAVGETKYADATALFIEKRDERTAGHPMTRVIGTEGLKT